MMGKDCELIANCIYNEIEKFPIAQTRVRVLNLSKNPITKDGAKLLGPALGGNKSIEILDLS